MSDIEQYIYTKPPIMIVIASEAKQSRLFRGDCHAPFRDDGSERFL